MRHCCWVSGFALSPCTVPARLVRTADEPWELPVTDIAAVIDTANKEAVRRILSADPVLVDVIPAHERCRCSRTI